MPKITPDLTKVHKFSRASLVFGAAGSEAEFMVTCSKASYEPDSKEDDPKKMIDGGEIPGDTTDTFKISGSIAQTFDASSLIHWAHENHNKVLPFEFIPDVQGDLALTGTVRIKRIGLGGDAGKQNDVDFEFSGVGEPELANTNVAGG